MDTRALGTRTAVLLVLLGVAPGCTTPTGSADGPPPEPEEVLPLELSVDRVDISHGALRLSATMVDGAADVSVMLGDACDRREVGGGLSTLSTLVWSLGEAEVADALACDLVIRARVRTETGHVMKEAPVSLTSSVTSSPENSEQGPQPREGSTSLDGVAIVFTSVGPSARLSAGDSLVEPTVTDEDDPDDTTKRFVVSRRDFARSLLLRWPFRMEGASFETSLSVGDTALETEEGEQEDVN
jgi:hypothetical protein